MFWWLLLLCMVVFSQVAVTKVHPIRLVGLTLGFGLVSAVSLVFNVGPLFGVSYFLVLVGGVLVVFAYAVALVPLGLDKSKGGKIKRDSTNNKWRKTFKLFLVMSGFILLLLTDFSEGSSFEFLFFTDCLYLSPSWGKMMVILSFFLFLSMVVVARICKLQKGALVR